MSNTPPFEIISIWYNKENDIVELDAVNDDPDFKDVLYSVISDFSVSTNAKPTRIVIVLIEVDIMKFRLYDQLGTFLQQLTDKMIIKEEGKVYINECAMQYDAEPNHIANVGGQFVLFKIRDDETIWQFSLIDC